MRVFVVSTSLLDKGSTNGLNVISICSRGIGHLNWKRFDHRDIHLLNPDRDQQDQPWNERGGGGHSTPSTHRTTQNDTPSPADHAEKQVVLTRASSFPAGDVFQEIAETICLFDPTRTIARRQTPTVRSHCVPACPCYRWCRAPIMTILGHVPWEYPRPTWRALDA
jgi:hypothetical protein